MPTFGEAVEEAVRLSLCALFAANESVNALLSPVFGNSGGLYPATSGLRRQLCSDPPSNDPVYVPPFEGGQCAGVSYRIQWSEQQFFSDCTSITGNPDVGGFIGPLGAVVYSGSPSCPTAPGTLARISTANGLVTLGGAGGGVLVTINSVTREDLAPDNCGDIPPVVGPPAPVEFPTDITYNIDGDTTINVPVVFVYSPFYISPTFNINGTVDFTVDGLEFKGEVTVSPEFNFNFSPKNIKPGPGVPDDDPGGGGGGGGTTPVPEDEDDFDAIIGVLVYSSVSGNNLATVLDSTDGPNIYAPRIGSVQFAIKTGNSIGWTADQDIKNLESYVPCPAPQGAIAVRVTPAPGITRTFTPVRGRPLTAP